MNRPLNMFRLGRSMALPLLLASCSSGPLSSVQIFTFPSGDHQEGQVQYEQTPPAGGPHNPTWQTCGVYASALYPEYVVHSLEHGAVWITYQASLSEVQVRALEQLSEGRTHVLVSPVRQQTAPVVLTAWGAQLEVPDSRDARVGAFLKRYERSSRSPEPGAPCTGGYAGTM